jgi:N-carbamoyl-L-amino-acid hydrolase
LSAVVVDLDYGLSRVDKEGVSIGQALQQIGYAGAHPVGGQAVHAAFELHIEQGPILEAQGLTIGMVTGAQGQRWYEVELIGRSAHAGTTPMDHRLDALLGFARAVEAVNQLGLEQGAEGRATVGMANIFPNSRNVVPGRVFFSVEFRHPDEAVLARQEEQLREAAVKLPVSATRTKFLMQLCKSIVFPTVQTVASFVRLYQLTSPLSEPTQD